MFLGIVQSKQSAWHFLDLQRNTLGDSLQRGTEAVASDAAADRVKLGHKAVHSPPRQVDRSTAIERAHLIKLG